MKITRRQLRQIIKEELGRLGEFPRNPTPPVVYDPDPTELDGVDDDGDGEIDEEGEKSEKAFSALLAEIRGTDEYKKAFEESFEEYVVDFVMAAESFDNNVAKVKKGAEEGIQSATKDLEDAKKGIAQWTSHHDNYYVYSLAIAEAEIAFWTPILTLVKGRKNIDDVISTMKSSGWSAASADELMDKLAKVVGA
jgi:hypothetical protein